VFLGARASSRRRCRCSPGIDVVADGVSSLARPHWFALGDRVLADDRKVSEKAAAELVQGGAESRPLLRTFSAPYDEGLRREASRIIHASVRALPLLTSCWDGMRYPSVDKPSVC